MPRLHLPQIGTVSMIIGALFVALLTLVLPYCGPACTGWRWPDRQRIGVLNPNGLKSSLLAAQNASDPENRLYFKEFWKIDGLRAS